MIEPQDNSLASLDTWWAYSLGKLNGSENLCETNNAKFVFVEPSLASA